MVFDEDIIDKKVIIVDGTNSSNISIEIEPIKNVTSILSAIGSNTAPIVDSSLYFLARKPSQ